MKKTVIGIALIISTLFAGTAVAQTPAQTDTKVKTEKCEARKEAGKAKDGKKAKRQEYLAKVKSILTPEQYVQFLEQQAMQNGGRKMAAKGGARHGKKGRAGKQQKGLRPAGTAPQAPAAKG